MRVANKHRLRISGLVWTRLGKNSWRNSQYGAVSVFSKNIFPWAKYIITDNIVSRLWHDLHIMRISANQYKNVTITSKKLKHWFQYDIMLTTFLHNHAQTLIEWSKHIAVKMWSKPHQPLQLDNIIVIIVQIWFIKLLTCGHNSNSVNFCYNV